MSIPRRAAAKDCRIGCRWATRCDKLAKLLSEEYQRNWWPNQKHCNMYEPIKGDECNGK